MQERTYSDSFKINRNSGEETYKEKLLATGLITSALQSVYWQGNGFTISLPIYTVFACGRRYSRIMALFFV